MNKKYLAKHNNIFFENESLFNFSNTLMISSLIALFSVGGIYLKIDSDKKRKLLEEFRIDNEKIKQDTSVQKSNLDQLSKEEKQQIYLIEKEKQERLALEKEIKQQQQEYEKYQTNIKKSQPLSTLNDEKQPINFQLTGYIDINLKNRQFWLSKMPKKTVALTFDDGPSPEYTEQVLNILNKYNIKATFFVVGYRIDKYCPLIKRIVAEGHELGNHTYHHNFLTKITPELQQQEMYKTQLAINNCVGSSYIPRWLRSPYGDQNETTLGIAHNLGLNTVLWSLDTNDWRPSSTSKSIVSQATKTNGQDIILMHDATEANPQLGLPESSNSRQNTVDSLEEIIVKLKANNINFATMSQAFLN